MPFIDSLVHGESDAINPAETGSKFAAWHEIICGPGEEAIVELVLTRQADLDPFAGLAAVFARRIRRPMIFMMA